MFLFFNEKRFNANEIRQSTGITKNGQKVNVEDVKEAFQNLVNLKLGSLEFGESSNATQVASKSTRKPDVFRKITLKKLISSPELVNELTRLRINIEKFKDILERDLEGN
jgi:hypothetical protein